MKWRSSVLGSQIAQGAEELGGPRRVPAHFLLLSPALSGAAKAAAEGSVWGRQKQLLCSAVPAVSAPLCLL